VQRRRAGARAGARTASFTASFLRRRPVSAAASSAFALRGIAALPQPRRLGVFKKIQEKLNMVGS